MTKIFLAELNPLSWQGSFEMGGNRMDPISIGYVSSYLRSKGLETQIFQQRKEKDQEVVELIRKSSPDYFGISAMTCCVNHSLEIARELKKALPRVKTIFGGYHPTGMPKILEDPSVDFVVLGEGEEVCSNLISAVEGNNSLEGVASIGFKKNGRTVFTPRAERISNLDALPFPDRYNLDECSQGAPRIPIPKNQNAFSQVAWSRGCLHNCSFCNSPQMWERQVYYRSAKNVADELEYLQTKFGTNAVFFTDLTFNEDREKVIELSEEIRKRSLDLKWSCSCRVTNDKEMLEAMKQAGCVRIGFGIESLDDRILAQVGKGITVRQVRECIETTNQVGIITRGYYMVGYPNQTQRDIDNFRDSVTSIPLDQIRISFLTPFPGTASFRSLQRRGAVVDNNLDHYDCDSHYVLKGKLSESELTVVRRELYKKFYSDSHYRERIKTKSKRFPELAAAYNELSAQVSRL